MFVLDTDHLVEFQKGTSSAAKQLKDRLRFCGDQVVSTIVTVEEVMRGWLAAIHRERDLRRQVRCYDRLGQLFHFYSRWEILPWDEAAAATFERQRRAGIRIGTMDLKIASITLVQGGTLLSSNLRDFKAIPELPVEDWLQVD